MRRNIISLSLSEELAEMMMEHWIDSGYASASEYIRELIRNDLRQNAGKPDRLKRRAPGSRTTTCESRADEMKPHV